MQLAYDLNATAFEIDAQILRLAAKKGALEQEIGRWLVIALRAGVHAKLGMGSFAEYAERRFGYSPRNTKDRLRVATALERLPRIQAELESGRRSWSAVRELVRVASPAHEAEWLAASEGKTVREVEALVSGLRPGERPSAPRDPLLARRRMVLDFAPEGHAIVLEALERKRRVLGPNTTNAEAMRAVCEDSLGAGRAMADEAAYQTAVTVCSECQRTWRHAAGELIEVPEEVGACALCDGELSGLVQVSEPGLDPEPQPASTDSTHVGQPTGPAPADPVGLEAAAPDPTHVGQPAPATCTARCVHSLIKKGGVSALLKEAALALGVQYRAVSPRVRGFVLARDQHRCSVPGCRNHLFVELHHLRRTRDGGTHNPENLTALCSVHHRHHHAGYLAIEGTPSTGLTFRHPGGTLYGHAPQPAMGA